MDLRQLVRQANELDKLGKHKEADLLDRKIKRQILVSSASGASGIVETMDIYATEIVEFVKKLRMLLSVKDKEKISIHSSTIRGYAEELIEQANKLDNSLK